MVCKCSNHAFLKQIFVGAYFADKNSRTDSGSAYVLWGRSSFLAFYDTDSLGENGLSFNGAAATDNL